jgi:hypothetical protein
MTEKDKSRKREADLNKAGSTMILALVLMLLATAIMGAYIRLGIQQVFLTRRMIAGQKARMVAEAGLEYAEMKLKDLVFVHALSLPHKSDMQALVDAIPTPVSPDPDFNYMTPTGGSAFRVVVETDVLQEQTITNGTACLGLIGDMQSYRIEVGAYSEGQEAGYVLGLRLQTVGVFLIRYAVFYDEDMEIWPGPDMFITGPVHANSDLYIGCNAKLYFSNRVTCAGNIYAERKYNDNQTPGDLKIKGRNNVMEPLNRGSYWLDSDYDDWINESLSVWDGDVLSQDHGIQTLRPPVDADSQTNLHDLIERPIPTNSPSYRKMTEAEKFANKAALYIHVDSTNGVTATAYSWVSPTNRVARDVSTNFARPVLNPVSTYNGRPVYQKDSNNQYVMLTNGNLDVSQTNFYDHRENRWTAPVDIYMDQFLPVIADSTNPDFNYTTNDFEGLVFITRDAPASDTSLMPVVRLRNGRELATNISVVSDLPVYVEGDYNRVNAKTSLMAGDAVTLLSGNWEDARSRENDKNERIPNESWFNTVIMTGNSETPKNGSSGDYNGGVENVLRFLENWSGKFTHYRGSIIDLWYSEIATGDWNGTYYSAPKRDWGYDDIYRTQCPPGMTRVFGMEELEWFQANWEIFNL